ncbi:MAG TPA: alpha/beta fold hydrolase [Gammaproteobacteria bacterium]|nr:alpha/beta fold hydrolase [Gammaproteobacteria bacterium]
MLTRKSARLCLLGLAALTSLTTVRETPAAVTAPVFSDCQIGGGDSPVHLQARCTSLTVAEDRAHPEERKIHLRVALLKARASEASPDPLVFIAGGPGQASTEAFVQEAEAFDRIRGTHDILLVDQRGTGGSNRLDCPAPPPGEDANGSDADIAKAAADCLKQLPGDPRFYTTSVAVEDLDAVRAALGYTALDLYGISYGTRVALQYLREFPAHTRSVVLDGVVPADLALGPGVSLDAQRALGLIFHRCGEDAACRQAFPNPDMDFARLETELKVHPASVTLRDPLTGAPRTETLTWDKLAGAVRLMSYQSETSSLLPLLIHQAATQHDYAPLMGTALMYTGEIESSFAEGMGSAVVCTEDVPFISDGAAEVQALHDTYLGSVSMELLVKSCRFWPKGVITSDFKRPVKSDKPVLLLSGEDDPVTPPANAARAARTLSDSLSLVVPGQGHGNVYRGCVPKIVADFIDAASVKGLDTACVKKIKPFPFFVNFSGPTP